MHPIQKLLLLVIFLPYCTQGQVITTVAGNGVNSYSGDGGPATAAEISYPRDVVIDKHGNILFTEEGNQVIRKIDTSGNISTIAGNGIMGFSGDGGYAVAAKLASPLGLALDRVGNIYFADFNNARIRKIDTAGIITTVAGTGTYGYNGDSIAATAAQIHAIDITTDSIGNIFIADFGNHLIRKINTSGIITTIAGNGIAGFSGDGGGALSASLTPVGIIMDKYDNIYFTDSMNRIRKINNLGIITTIAGNGSTTYSGDGGMATNAGLSSLESLTIDDTGNIYFTNSERVRKISTSGIIIRIAGTGVGFYSGDGGNPLLADIGGAIGIVFDNNYKFYIACNAGVNRIRCIDYSKKLSVAEEQTGTKYNLSLSPNPVTGGALKVLLHSAVNEEVGISITDVLGKVVLRTTVYTNTESDVPINLPAGVYYLEAVTSFGRVAERVVVE